MVTTNSTDGRTNERVRLLKEVVKSLKPILKYLDQPHSSGKRLVYLGPNVSGGQYFLDRSGTFFYMYMASLLTPTEINIEDVIEGEGFEEVLGWLRGVLEKRTLGLKERQTAIENVAFEILRILAGYVSYGYLSPITPIVVAGASFHWDSSKHELLLANFSTYCPRHLDGNCHSVTSFENWVVAQISLLGDKVYSVGHFSHHPERSSAFCPGETCGIHFRVPKKGLNELIWLTTQFLTDRELGHTLLV